MNSILVIYVDEESMGRTLEVKAKNFLLRVLCVASVISVSH
tara:strand:+ start:925 stop:1047 length:123 start_codon:yes stop_codon:yes gene_type:complete